MDTAQKEPEEKACVLQSSGDMKGVLGTVRRVPQQKLGVSEPDPYGFGNPKNENGNASWTNNNWLKSRFHFSFAEYHNGRNQNFGVLRVMNDDLVQPLRGFGTHGHRDAEICTYVVEGHLTHQDSMGTSETLTRGAVQFMTAGRGVRHSEHNKDKGEPLRFIQMWLTPRASGLKPNYGSSPGSKEARTNTWHHMASDVDNTKVSTDVKINTDANLLVAEIDEGSGLPLSVNSGRQAYMLCIEGMTCILDEHDGQVCTVKGVNLKRHDAAEFIGPVTLKVTGPSHLLVVEMAYDARSHGRGDL